MCMLQKALLSGKEPLGVWLSPEKSGLQLNVLPDHKGRGFFLGSQWLLSILRFAFADSEVERSRNGIDLFLSEGGWVFWCRWSCLLPADSRLPHVVCGTGDPTPRCCFLWAEFTQIIFLQHWRMLFLYKVGRYSYFFFMLF